MFKFKIRIEYVNSQEFCSFEIPSHQTQTVNDYEILLSNPLKSKKFETFENPRNKAVPIPRYELEFSNMLSLFPEKFDDWMLDKNFYGLKKGQHTMTIPKTGYYKAWIS